MRFHIHFMTKEGNFGRITQPTAKVGMTVTECLKLGDTVTKIERVQ